jgi:hypothetical protein
VGGQGVGCVCGGGMGVGVWRDGGVVGWGGEGWWDGVVRGGGVGGWGGDSKTSAGREGENRLRAAELAAC